MEGGGEEGAGRKKNLFHVLTKLGVQARLVEEGAEAVGEDVAHPVEGCEDAELTAMQGDAEAERRGRLRK